VAADGLKILSTIVSVVAQLQTAGGWIAGGWTPGTRQRQSQRPWLPWPPSSADDIDSATDPFGAAWRARVAARSIWRANHEEQGLIVVKLLSMTNT